MEKPDRPRFARGLVLEPSLSAKAPSWRRLPSPYARFRPPLYMNAIWRARIVDRNRMTAEQMSVGSRDLTEHTTSARTYESALGTASAWSTSVESKFIGPDRKHGGRARGGRVRAARAGECGGTQCADRMALALIVDGFILIATAAAVLLRDRSWRVTWVPVGDTHCLRVRQRDSNALHANNHADRDAMSGDGERSASGCAVARESPVDSAPIAAAAIRDTTRTVSAPRLLRHVPRGSRTTSGCGTRGRRSRRHKRWPRCSRRSTCAGDDRRVRYLAGSAVGGVRGEQRER